MTSSIVIPRHEHGVIRVFAISRPIAGVARALKQQPKAALATELLGHPVTSDTVELFALSDLTGVGLSRYLADGYDIEPEALRADHSRLEGLDGYVLLLFSSVAKDNTVTLRLHAYGDLRPFDSPFDMVDTLMKEPKPDPKMSGRIAMIALLVAFAVAGGMVWMAG